MITQNITLYCKKYSVPPVVHAVQNDTNREVAAHLGDLTLTGSMTAELSVFRSDGTHYDGTATIDTETNTVTAEIDQALTQAGKQRCQIKVTESDGTGSTFAFIIDSQPDTDGVSEEQDGWSVQQLVEYLATSYPVSFTATLAAASWSSGAQTITDDNFIASGYTYFVSASPDDTYDYEDARIYADDVTTDGEMVFHCDDDPINDLEVNIVRMKLMP